MHFEAQVHINIYEGLDKLKLIHSATRRESE